MKQLLLTFLLFISSLCYSQTQCTIDVPSSNGYTVHIELEMVALNVPATCTNPTYNYTVDIDYDITFIGGGGSLWTLQGTIGCDDDSPFFNLPNNGGTGTVTTSTATRNLVQGDCGTATFNSLNCGDFQIVINGQGISYQTITCTALPIELLHYDAYRMNNYVLVKWISATETNNDYFTIEKSIDLYNWEAVEYVDGAGNSFTPISYEIKDYDEIREITYYRLTQTDYEIVAVSPDLKSNFRIYPNTIKDNKTLTIESTEIVEFIEIYDVIGGLQKTEYNKEVSEIDVSNLSQGLYILKVKVESNPEIIIEKIIVE
jgi:hypothetical protein